MSMALTACSTSGGDKRQAQILALAEIANQKKISSETSAKSYRNK